jgi:hypothetical protein
MDRKDLMAMCAHLTVACMAMASDLEHLEGALAVALQDALASCEATQDAIQTVLLAQDDLGVK